MRRKLTTIAVSLVLSGGFWLGFAAAAAADDAPPPTSICRPSSITPPTSICAWSWPTSVG